MSDQKATRVDVLEARLEALEATLVQQAEELKKLRANSGGSIQFDAQVNTEPLPVAEPFDIEGVMYRFKYAKFVVEGRTVLAHEAASDAEFCLRMLEEYPSLIDKA